MGEAELEAMRQAVAGAKEQHDALFPGVPDRPDPAQLFFATYAAEIRGPNYGDHARDWVRTMLARAEAAGLYTPEQP